MTSTTTTATFTIPTGEVITKTSKKAYSHAVALRWNDTSWKIYHFCGNRVNAEKHAAQYGAWKNNKPEMVIIPAN